MFVACGIWCLADVSSVSPSSEQSFQFTLFYIKYFVCFRLPPFESLNIFFAEKKVQLMNKNHFARFFTSY